MNKKGSALVFVSLVMAFVGVIAILFTRSALLHYGCAIDRIHYLRSQYALEALAEYGIAHTLSLKKNSTKEWQEEFSCWPPLDGPYRASVKANIKKKTYLIHAEVFQKDSSCGTISCKLRMPEKGKPIVESWSYSNLA